MAKLQPVDGPPRRPPRYGLVVSAPPLEGVQLPTEGPWELWGITWEPEACASTSGRRNAACSGNTAALDGGSQAAVTGATPFVVYGADDCSMLGGITRDRHGRAMRALMATRSYQVAQELWTGTLLAADSNADADRLVLTDVSSDTVSPAGGGGMDDVVEALACLEQGYAQCSQGQQGMIHATVQLQQLWASRQAIRREGNQWLTPSDNLVVADAGYDGSGPGGTVAGATQWAYATDLVRLGFGQVLQTPAPGEYPLPDLLTNDVTVYAQQWALYTSDRCCHLAVEVQLPVCAIGAPS